MLASSDPDASPPRASAPPPHLPGGARSATAGKGGGEGEVCVYSDISRARLGARARAGRRRRREGEGPPPAPPDARVRCGRVAQIARVRVRGGEEEGGRRELAGSERWVR